MQAYSRFQDGDSGQPQESKGALTHTAAGRWRQGYSHSGNPALFLHKLAYLYYTIFFSKSCNVFIFVADSFHSFQLHG